MQRFRLWQTPPILSFLGVWCFCAISLWIALGAEPNDDLPDQIQFNRDIRPILSEKCFACHGPDDKNRDGDLRLDTQAGATADRGDYAAVVPGKPADSALLERVRATDVDILMPPPDSKKERLSPRQVALLTKWIEQGAKYEGHWAFLTLAQVDPPQVVDDHVAGSDQPFVRNPIDTFILQKLQEHKLLPSAAADRATLIRRMSLDVVGLLPEPEEVAAFEADESPDAAERLADRLFADPHYGERWGRHWLDHARYADSHGYSIDGERTQWPYRDWVIRAFQEDRPFDQFTIDQLAGDLLPNPTQAQLVATGFHRNTLINQEGGTDPEQFRNEAVVDRVNTTGAVWLGLTVGCAQCHSHKYDPISHQEYYRLFAFFNQGEDVNNKGATTTVRRGEMFGLPAVAPTIDYEAQLVQRQTRWEQSERERLEQQVAAQTPKPGKEDLDKPADWKEVKYLEYDTTSNAGLQMLDDHSLLADGKGDANDTYRVLIGTELPQVAALRLRVLPHESLPKQGPGLAGNGNFVLTGVEVTCGGKAVPILAAMADHEQPGYPAAAAIDGKGNTGWAINIGPGQKGKVMNAPHEIVLAFDTPVEAAGKDLEVCLKHEMNERYLIGRFALDVSANKPPLPAATPAKENLLAVLQVPVAKRSAEQKKQLEAAFLKSDPEAKKWSDAQAAFKKAQANQQAEVMIMRDRSQRRETHLLTRGDFLRPDKELGPLQPGVIAAVQAGFQLPADQFQFGNRLDLARWLVHPENPLTPRVTMNRVWLHYFGRGLVETEEDFGTQGTFPSHPELLDWLGREFIRSGWSLRHMQQLVVTSATYRQSSFMRSDLTQADPLNKWLGRQSRLRVEGEIVRDAALSAAGLLTSTQGGPSVHPPQPDGVYAFTQNRKNWTTPNNEDRFRRGVYTFFYRSAPYPLLTTFDAPDFQTVCTRRTRSNTPLQSLTLANDAAFVEIAQGLALRVVHDVPASGNDEATTETRVRRAFLLCFQREPSTAELATLQKYFRHQVSSFSAAPKDAAALLTADLRNLDPKSISLQSADPNAVVAAWVSVARVLLNTDAFITRE